MVDNQIAELEAGFQDLLGGLRAIIRVLRDENELLRARLDERRMMASPLPAPELPVAAIQPSDTIPLVPTLIVESLPIVERRRGGTHGARNPVLSAHICKECGNEYLGGPKTNFCKPCLSARMSANMKQRHVDGKINYASLQKGRRMDTRTIDQIDARIDAHRSTS